MRSATNLLVITTTFALLAGGALAQQPVWKQNLESGKVMRDDGRATVTCNHPEALYEAIRAVRETYGWTVSYEAAPLYSSYDVKDVTDSNWRKKHPNGPRALMPSGGKFQTHFSESADMSDRKVQEFVLNKIVADYNASTLPGKYKLLPVAEDTFSIVGTMVRDEQGKQSEIDPLLDLPVTLAKQQRTVGKTVQSILDELSISQGKRIRMIEFPSNVFSERVVNLGAEGIPARLVLQTALRSSGRSIMWELRYDPGIETYLFSAYVAVKREYNEKGEAVSIPIDTFRADPRN